MQELHLTRLSIKTLLSNLYPSASHWALHLILHVSSLLIVWETRFINLPHLSSSTNDFLPTNERLENIKTATTTNNITKNANFSLGASFKKYSILFPDIFFVSHYLGIIANNLPDFRLSFIYLLYSFKEAFPEYLILLQIKNR